MPNTVSNEDKLENKKKKSNVNILNKQNRIRILFIVVALAFCVICTRFYISLLKTNMLPTKYVAIATIVEIVFIFFVAIGLVKKHKTLKINIFCLIIAVIISIGILVVNNYVDVTMKYLGKMFTQVTEVEEYYVVVPSDSLYTKIEDLEGREIQSIQLDEDVKHNIQSKVLVAIVDSDNLLEMGRNLLDKSIVAIAISSSQYTMLDDEIEGFISNTKIIDTESKEIQVEESIEDANSNYKIGNGVFNVYLSGIDVFGDINKVSRTDSNMVATVNMNTHEILLTSIPRDYYVTLHKYRAKDKLTHSGIYGINETVNTVEDFLGIDINYYLRVNFTTLIDLVNILDGVDVYSDLTFSCRGYERPYVFQEGYNHISDGYTAMVFCRERNAFKEGDNQRIKNQQHVLEGIIKKISSSNTILTKYTSILEALAGSFNTNVSRDDIAKLVKSQLETMPSWTIKTNSLTGYGATRTTFSMGSEELYVTIPDQKSINEAKTKIQELMNKR